jgi:predicted Zn-dependent protease
MENAADELKGTAGFNWMGFAAAANYSYQNKVDLEQGLKWADMAVARQNSFTTLKLKSDILKELGKTEEADKTMKMAIEEATEDELNQYGYQLLNTQNFAKAIEILKMNTQRHPKSANTWDSLGEAYFLQGDKKKAAANFKKSLSLNPPANVRANSEKFLKQMGEK